MTTPRSHSASGSFYLLSSRLLNVLVMSQRMQNTCRRHSPRLLLHLKMLFSQRKSFLLLFVTTEFPTATPNLSRSNSSPASPKPSPLAQNISYRQQRKLAVTMPTQNHIQVAIACPADVETVQGETGSTTTHSVLFFAPEYDPNQDTITGLINPGRSLSPFASPTIPLAYPLVKFMPSVSDKNYCVIVKVLPGYVFENPEHDFLRITLYIDGRKRVVRTVSAQQIVHNGSDRPYTIAIHGQGEGRNFYWKSIVIGMDDDAEPQPHDEWNYDLGSIQVYIHRMRAKEGEGSGEDAGDSDAVVEETGEEEIEVDARGSGCVEGEE